MTRFVYLSEAVNLRGQWTTADCVRTPRYSKMNSGGVSLCDGRRQLEMHTNSSDDLTLKYPPCGSDPGSN